MGRGRGEAEAPPPPPASQPPRGALLSPQHQQGGVQRQLSLRQPAFDRLSLSSQTAELDENGFYDNIRVTAPQEDQQSVTSRRTIGAPFLSRDNGRSPLPAKPANRIGQLIRKLGGVPERPLVHQAPAQQHQQPQHGSALSLHQPAARPGLLMKSSSLSHEPWRVHALEKETDKEGDKGGLGNRLRQTLFGGRKRVV